MPSVMLRLLLLAAVAAAGWQVNGWRWEAKWRQREAAIAAATAATEAENRVKGQVLADAFARIDTDRTAEKRKGSIRVK